MSYTIGIDAGSTTVKTVVVNERGEVLFKDYTRHLSNVRDTLVRQLQGMRRVLGSFAARVAITGSAGLGLAENCKLPDGSALPFVQEVFATSGAVKKLYPQTDTVIELGGEDAKIIFLTGLTEQRMNGTCAGGTGAFIDQMATLLGVTPEQLDEMALRAEKVYPIASRCGVFAKSDIQPLLNQGAKKEDLAASIFRAVVDQTVSGLAQGRDITGNVLFLGGPLSFFKGLQKAFIETLSLTPQQALFPEIAPYFVALGAAMYAKDLDTPPFPADTVIEAIRSAQGGQALVATLPPLFASQEEYDAFAARHQGAGVEENSREGYTGDAYLGVDAGSTTTKLVLLDSDKRILYSYYSANEGNPVNVVKNCLTEIYTRHPGVHMRGSAVTGYGEDLIKNAFALDLGLVETMAHYTAARYFRPNVDFIIDIGGQDIKCFKIKNGAIDSIMLNEACSSGCGSFIETFARALGYTIDEFAKLALFAPHPVDLGSRCTVFMNSSVKQAQKDGATVGDISAGLSVSIVKNALYKVIRASSAAELGENVVVQGGTFLNDAVLRSFEQELGREVTRPAIAGLMGAFGAALYAMDHMPQQEKSTLMDMERLTRFEHTSKATNCGLCTTHCPITVNTFTTRSDGQVLTKRYISGNRCERPLGIKQNEVLPDIYIYKYDMLRQIVADAAHAAPQDAPRVGIALALNMLENLPFWTAFFAALGVNVDVSGESSRKLYHLGQHSIPSDTVCYPAKLVHGHIESLLAQGVKHIFYPCQTYNFNEGNSDNHYNCPVVAYYPELLKANVKGLTAPGVHFMMPYLDLTHPRFAAKVLVQSLAPLFPDRDLSVKQVRDALQKGFEGYRRYKDAVFAKGQEILDFAKAHGKRCIVLVGRPYHIDPEINHGINRLITSLGLCVLSEDSICNLAVHEPLDVLNQWTFHSRMYNAAELCAHRDDLSLVQLVSFGCGIDAITTDEIRAILERNGKLYTLLKIDEINNLGAVKIRLRSLLAV